MSAVTGIEWTDRTWNPVTGCTKVSPGCAHCYAEGVAVRFWAKQYPPVRSLGKPGVGSVVEYERPRQFTDVMTHEDRLLEPLSWRKPARVFVNSMSDLFHEDVPDAFIDKVFAVMALARRHTFQVLTKRPKRMRTYLNSRTDTNGGPTRDVYQSAYYVTEDNHAGGRVSNSPWPLPNVWLGVSVENQQFLERVDILKDVPAAVHFVSFEPLLEDLGALILDGIQWAIVGGESGPGARLCRVEWIRSILAQCAAAGVPCFVKQLGANPISAWGLGQIRDPKGGDIEEFPEDLRVREFPA